MRRVGVVALLAFVGTVVAANWAIERYGVVSVGFGLVAPAGVYFAGLALVMRDLVQETLGRVAVVAAILVGAALSYWVGDAVAIPGGHVSIAVASGVAFLVSELCDFAVYTPLRESSLTAGVVISNVVGAVVDSALFLWLAFGSLAFFQGQVVGKLWMTIPALLVIAATRRVRTATA